jgi:hypothetical protein
MSRKHLFPIVVLLGAATIAGLLAVTRTVDLGTAAQSASGAEIAARSRSLDRLEASLRRSLASRPPALPSRSSAPSSSLRTVAVRAGAAPAPTFAGEWEDDHGRRGHEDESEHEEHGGEDD